MTTSLQCHETRLRMKRKGWGPARAFTVQELVHLIITLYLGQILSSVWPNRPSGYPGGETELFCKDKT